MLADDIKQDVENGTCTPITDLVINTTQKQTKFVTGTKIDLMKAVKYLILVDTGANESFTPNLSWIHGIKYFKTPQKAMVGDGFKCQVLAIGYWLIPTNDGRIKPSPVKYAPELPSVYSCEHAVSTIKSLTGHSIHQHPNKTTFNSRLEHQKESTPLIQSSWMVSRI